MENSSGAKTRRGGDRRGGPRREGARRGVRGGGSGNRGNFHRGVGQRGVGNGTFTSNNLSCRPMTQEPNEETFGNLFPHPPPLAPYTGYHPINHPQSTNEQSNDYNWFSADGPNRNSRPESDRQRQYSNCRRGSISNFQPEIPPPNFRGSYPSNLKNDSSNFHQAKNDIYFRSHATSSNTQKLYPNKEYLKNHEKELKNTVKKSSYPEQMGSKKDMNSGFQSNPVFSDARSVYNKSSNSSYTNYHSVENLNDTDSTHAAYQQHRQARNQYATVDQTQSRPSRQQSNNFSSDSKKHNSLQYRTLSSTTSNTPPNVGNEWPSSSQFTGTRKPETDYHRHRARSHSNSFNTENIRNFNRTRQTQGNSRKTGSNSKDNNVREHFSDQVSKVDVSSCTGIRPTERTHDIHVSATNDFGISKSNELSNMTEYSSITYPIQGVLEGFRENGLNTNTMDSKIDINKGERHVQSQTALNIDECRNNKDINQVTDKTNRRTVEELDNILSMDPEGLVQLLNGDKYSDIFEENLSTKNLILTIAILGKVCSADSSNHKGEILRKASLPVFLDQIFTFLSKLPYLEDQSLLQYIKCFYTNVITFYSTLSDFLPSAVRIWITHLRELKKSIKMTEKHLNLQIDCNILSMLNVLLEEIDVANKTDEHMTEEQKHGKKKVANTYFPEPIGDFRTVSLFPRPEDIYSEQPFLYPNVVTGPYRSVDQYLDTQFKLLREDFISPIRQAIRDFKNSQNSKEKFKRIDNVRIYRKVKFLHPKTITDKVGYEICFDVDNKINKVNWEYSNRFMFGSLLFFTNDHFDHFFLATVANRNIKELEAKRVTVEIRGPLLNEKSILGKEFVMAESEAYFEPYYNVLKALQMFHESNFPLARYIVDVVTETQPPKYLSQEDIYNIHLKNNNFSFRVLNDNEWPTNEDLGLDPSQYEAYKASLTNDIIVVQGPPGTGKTFLGLRITQSLLENARVWNRTSSPILVVCYTNHALDQFLEGLLPFTSKLVRIGGKSKGNELDKYNIRERRKEQNYYKKANFAETRALKLKMSTVFSDMKKHQMNIKDLDDVDGILALRTLHLVMSDHQKVCFRDDEHFIDWLLVGIGQVENEVKVKFTVTADRGVVKETSVISDHTTDDDDERIKQAFFDTIELESVPISKETVVVHYAYTLNSIQNTLKDIEAELESFKSSFNRSNLKSTSEKIRLILTHLRKELLACKELAHSDNEKKYLMEFSPLHDLLPSCRWKLYHTWVEILKNGLIMELNKKEEEYKELAFMFEQLRQGDDLQILKTSHVVGTTTTIAAKLQPLFTALAPKIVIVEEAAEVLEAHIIASLTSSCEHLILIGDHKQLRPNVAEVRMARQYQLDVSLFERMVENGMACHTLTLQHRMRPEISKQLVPTIYPTLEDHISVQGRENIRGMDKNVFFMTHSNFEDEVVEITSKRNRYEADILLKLAKYLTLQGYNASDITILATYKGQMYHMKNEIKKMDGFPRGIQITVVDNFQGEENKIILLSLVRSNALKKIGFLEIENRVCVALSRAKDALYILGNMDNLVASSKIWPHIKNSLLQQQSFGSSLVLRCQNHPNQTTLIRSVNDFSKVSEGGCSLVCDQPLSCGHMCKSMCHISQNYHTQIYRCKEPCSRILCNEGHQCPNKCWMQCKPCEVLVNRGLPCGHFADVPCHEDIRRFKCTVPVEVNLEDCMHTVTVPCHSKANAQCNIPCNVRLECGHTCEQLCHVNVDPDHLQFVCRKPCPRLNQDCSEEHKCTLLCCDECQPCKVQVKKQLPCGHSARTRCCTNILTLKCYKRCERIPACGHACDKLCGDSCSPCLFIVEKKVPQCGHIVKIPCNQEPTRLLCGGPCVVKMPCGHQCNKLCRDTCSTLDCEHPTELKSTTLLCGHTNAQIPCNKVDKVRTMSEEELLQFCAEPCGKMLTCKHPCSGSCNECMQGRIHKVCDQPCNNVLICGHSCQVPCRYVCPPCKKPCLHHCKHSKCPKKCGEVCSPCNEPCDYACEHLKCTMRCKDLCDREPCYEDCTKQLACSHACVGFCGEPCPPCRQCEPTHFETFFGTEDEEDAKWIYLENCKHTFESSGLEYWLNMSHDGKEILSKVCPRCKTPIATSQRFMNLIKTTYQDIQKVKSRCYGKNEMIKKQRLQSLRKLQQLGSVHELLPESETDELMVLYRKLNQDLPEEKYRGKVNKRNALDAQKASLLCFSTEFFVSLYERKKETWSSLNGASKILVTQKINFLTFLLGQRKLKISEQEMKSFECELKRIHRLFDLLVYSSSPEYLMAGDSSEAFRVNKEAMKLISSLAAYDDSVDTKIKALLAKLKELIKSSTQISDAERAMINKAMGSSFHSSQKTGHWFKCKKGHIYCITECGGAMEVAKCPVFGCDEKIGGENHSLRADQEIASEMDGASYAAWSEQNNLANFGFEF